MIAYENKITLNQNSREKDTQHPPPVAEHMDDSGAHTIRRGTAT